MFYLQEEQKSGILFAIEFEKTFDSISLKFVQKNLKFLNFGSSIIKWFDMFYYKATGSALSNGFISQTFPFERGCRQGDPLSPYILIVLRY